MNDYSKRIPAAIAKGNEHLSKPNPGCLWPNESEVTLAGALWALLVHESRGGRDYMVDEPPAPLIVFTEKVERLEL